MIGRTLLSLLICVIAITNINASQSNDLINDSEMNLAHATIPNVNIMDYGADNTGADNTVNVAALESAMSDGHVYFPPGKYYFHRPVRILSDRIIWGSKKDPPILMHPQDRRSFFHISTYDSVRNTDKDQSDARNIIIRWLIMDMNMSDWRQFSTCITFEGHLGYYIDNIRIHNITFINSKQPIDAPPSRVGVGNGDSWWINLSSFASRNSRLRIYDCNAKYKGYQLTSGGGSGWNDVVIRNNYVNAGQANAIAISAKSRNIANTLQYIKIYENVLEDIRGSGIFIGIDGNPANGVVFMRYVRIMKNTMTIGPVGGKFVTCILIKTGIRIENITLEQLQNIALRENMISHASDITHANRHIYEIRIKHRYGLETDATRSCEKIYVSDNKVDAMGDIGDRQPRFLGCKSESGITGLYIYGNVHNGAGSQCLISNSHVIRGTNQINNWNFFDSCTVVERPNLGH